MEEWKEFVILLLLECVTEGQDLFFSAMDICQDFVNWAFISWHL